MSAEYKIFTKNEIEFILKVLEKHGCCNQNDDESIDQCPFWSWDVKDGEGKAGDCIRKHSEKFCVILKAIVENDDLTLVVRSKEIDDRSHEREEEKKIVLHNVQNVKSKINSLKITENELVKRMHKLK